jgi:hypothetical protein
MFTKHAAFRCKWALQATPLRWDWEYRRILAYGVAKLANNHRKRTNTQVCPYIAHIVAGQKNPHHRPHAANRANITAKWADTQVCPYNAHIVAGQKNPHHRPHAANRATITAALLSAPRFS